MSRVFFVALFCLFTLNIKWGLEICFATYKKLVHKKDTRVIEDSKKIKNN